MRLIRFSQYIYKRFCHRRNSRGELLSTQNVSAVIYADERYVYHNHSALHVHVTGRPVSFASFVY